MVVLGFQKEFERRVTKSWIRDMVHKMDRMKNGQGPEHICADLRPMDAPVNEHCSGYRHDSSNASFGNTIVMVSTWSRPDRMLKKIFQVFLKFSRSECRTVIGEILGWNYTMA